MRPPAAAARSTARSSAGAGRVARVHEHDVGGPDEVRVDGLTGDAAAGRHLEANHARGDLIDDDRAEPAAARGVRARRRWNGRAPAAAGSMRSAATSRGWPAAIASSAARGVCQAWATHLVAEQADLGAGRELGGEEPGVESARQSGRGDPARQRDEAIGPQPEAQRLDHRGEGARDVEQLGAGDLEGAVVDGRVGGRGGGARWRPRRQRRPRRPRRPAGRRSPRTSRGSAAMNAAIAATGSMSPPRAAAASSADRTDRAISRGSASAASTRPPGKTCISGAKAMVAGRWVRRTSRAPPSTPAAPSTGRSSTTVAAARGATGATGASADPGFPRPHRTGRRNRRCVAAPKPLARRPGPAYRHAPHVAATQRCALRRTPSPRDDVTREADMVRPTRRPALILAIAALLSAALAPASAIAASADPPHPPPQPAATPPRARSG